VFRRSQWIRTIEKLSCLKRFSISFAVPLSVSSLLTTSFPPPLHSLIQAHVIGRQLGFLGEPHVNSFGIELGP